MGITSSRKSEKGFLPKRIIYFIERPFTEYFQRLYGVTTLLENGFDVTVWDFTALVAPTLVGIKVPDPSRFEQVVIMSDRKGALRQVRALTSADFVIMKLHFGPGTLDFFRALSESGAGYLMTNSDAVAIGRGSADLRVSIKDLARRLTGILTSSAKWRAAIFHRLPPSIWRIKPAALIVAGGGEAAGHIKHLPTGPRTELLWSHASDYDRLMGLRSKQRAVEHIVFLDEYLPFHYDNEVLGLGTPSDPQVYYAELRRFFALIEARFHCRVVVAAHPKSDYGSHPDYFGGRRVERDQTPELLLRAKFVILHASTSVNLANILDLPAVFVTNEQIKRTYLEGWITNIAKWYGKSPINLSDGKALDSINWDRELAVNKEAYAAFRRQFIKRPGTPEVPTWQMVSERLKQLLECH